MDRISGAGFLLDGSGHRVFQDINQAAGISGTDVVSLWLNGVQESILAVVAAASSPALAPTDADNTQMLQAIQQLIAAAETAAINAAEGFATAAANAAQAAAQNFATGAVAAYAARFTNVNGSSGYEITPNGRILQWVFKVNSGGPQLTAVNWPIPFPASCDSAIVCTANSTTSANGASTGSLNQTGANVSLNGAYSFTVWGIGR